MTENPKKNDLDIILKWANKKNDAAAFISWLKKKRPKSTLNKGLGSRYSNKLFKITNLNEYKKAEQLCQRINELVKPRQFISPDGLKILKGIVHRAVQDANKFKDIECDYNMLRYELVFLDLIDVNRAAKVVLEILKEGNVPLNDETEFLYESLLEYDSYYAGVEKLYQRRILSYSLRGADFPPFYAADNVSLLHKNLLVPCQQLTPNEISEIENQKFKFTSEIGVIEWKFLILESKHSIKLYSEKGNYLGEAPSGQADLIFRKILKPSNIKDGLTKEQFGFGQDEEQNIKTCVSRINAIVKPDNQLIISKHHVYRINPELPMLYVQVKK